MMTKKELAQKIKDSNYTCTGINCKECISVNGFGCCLQEDRRLFVSLVLPVKNKKKTLKKLVMIIYLIIFLIIMLGIPLLSFII